MTLTESPPGVATGGADDPYRSSAPSLLRMDTGLFLVSVAVLTLEILQFKVFAYSLDPLRIYIAVGICLLGLGASGTLLSILPRAPIAKAIPRAAFFAALGGLLLPGVHVLFAEMAGSLVDDDDGGAILTLVVLTLPYFCFGMAVSLLLVSRAAKMGRAYGVNLGGSAAGCLLVFPLLEWLGAERGVSAVGLLAVASACVLHVPRTRVMQGAMGLAAAALLVTFVVGERILPFPPDPTGQLATVQRSADKIRRENPDERVEVVHEHKQWDRTARVDVYQLQTSIPRLQSRSGGPFETRFFVQDSSAASFLLGVEDDMDRGKEFFEGTLYGSAYQMAPRENVLLIGLGGAPDVLTALYHGADRIQGVDINGSTIELVREDFADFLGDPYGRPEVEIHQMDGRTFLRSVEEKFDLIQMSGVDTKSVFASGSLSVNENYIYTEEAMGEMLARIEDDGVICFLRFGDADAHKLTSIAVKGLENIGIEDPRRHLFALRQGVMRSVLIKRTPFTDAEVESLHGWVEDRGGEPADVRIPCYDWIDVGFGYPVSVMYSPEPRPVEETGYYRALEKGSLRDYVEILPRDLSAPTDDRPFFFYRERFLRFPPAATDFLLLVHRPSDVLMSLFRLVGQLALVSGVFILLPLVVLKGRGLRTPRAGRSIVYFTCLGMGFMLFEIGLMHRFVLLLGHQSYAVTVVLLGLLVGASLGSASSGYLSTTSKGPVRAALLVLVAAIVLSAFYLGDVFEWAATFDFGSRLGLSLGLLVALGFLLGIPFPTALRSLEGVASPLVPWGIGINGFASVIGSTLAVPVAMILGLQSLLFTAAVLYFLAILTAPLGPAGGEARG